MSAPVETKVQAATVGAAVGTIIAGGVVLLLDRYVFNGSTPDAVQTLVYAAVLAGLSAGSTFILGYQARHTSRVAPGGAAP